MVTPFAVGTLVRARRCVLRVEPICRSRLASLSPALISADPRRSDSHTSLRDVRAQLWLAAWTDSLYPRELDCEMGTNSAPATQVQDAAMADELTHSAPYRYLRKSRTSSHLSGKSTVWTPSTASPPPPLFGSWNKVSKTGDLATRTDLWHLNP